MNENVLYDCLQICKNLGWNVRPLKGTEKPCYEISAHFPGGRLAWRPRTEFFIDDIIAIAEDFDYEKYAAKIIQREVDARGYYLSAPIIDDIVKDSKGISKALNRLAKMLKELRDRPRSMDLDYFSELRTAKGALCGYCKRELCDGCQVKTLIADAYNDLSYGEKVVVKFQPNA